MGCGLMVGSTKKGNCAERIDVRGERRKVAGFAYQVPYVHILSTPPGVHAVFSSTTWRQHFHTHRRFPLPHRHRCPNKVIFVSTNCWSCPSDKFSSLLYHLSPSLQVMPTIASQC